MNEKKIKLTSEQRLITIFFFVSNVVIKAGAEPHIIEWAFASLSLKKINNRPLFVYSFKEIVKKYLQIKIIMKLCLT
jgi:hypothetical protein